MEPIARSPYTLHNIVIIYILISASIGHCIAIESVFLYDPYQLDNNFRA